jgi:MFS family permease
MGDQLLLPQSTPGTKEVSKNFSLFTVWFALFCDYCLLTIAVPIFPQLGKSDFQTGLLFSTKAILQVLSAPIVARYIDGYELEPLVLGLLIQAVSTLVFAFTQDYYWWCLARGISGISSSMIISAGFLHIQRRWASDNEGMGVAMSVVTTGIITGVTFGPPIGGLLYGINHGLPFFFMIGLIACAGCTALTLFRRLAASSINNKLLSAAKEIDAPGVYRTKLFKLITDKHIVVTLLALFFANAAIACMEATFGNYMEDEFGFTVQQIGFLYVIAAAPSVIGSKIAGPLGNKHGRHNIVFYGMFICGAFYALGPKTILWVEIVSLVMLGFGIGLVDGCAPALLGQRSEQAHGGTGIVYTLNTMAVQCGFIFGPIAGSAIMQHHGFAIMSYILGGFMVLVSPLVLINRNMPQESGKVVEGEKEVDEEEGGDDVSDNVVVWGEANSAL